MQTTNVVVGFVSRIMGGYWKGVASAMFGGASAMFQSVEEAQAFVQTTTTIPIFWQHSNPTTMVGRVDIVNAVQYPESKQVTSQPALISLALPDYLQTVSLPGLNTSITRVSDTSVFGGAGGLAGPWFKHYYSKQQPWNRDGSILMLSFFSNKVFFLDGNNYTYLGNNTTLPYALKWSNTDPDILYGVKALLNPGTGIVEQTFVAYHYFTGVTQPLAYYGEFTYLTLGNGEGNLSDDNAYAPLIGQDANGLTVICFDLINNVEVSRKVFLGAVFSAPPGDHSPLIDWVSTSPSGAFVVVNIYADAQDGASAAYDVYDRNMTFLRTLTTDAGGHADIGYDSAGNEVMFCGSYVGGKGVYLYTVRLTDSAIEQMLPGLTELPVPFLSPPGDPTRIPPYMTSNYHLSCRNTARHGYGYVSGYSWTANTDAVMYHEVYALKLDGSGEVERFSQDFKLQLPTNNDPYAYPRAAMAVPNRNGSLVLFSSDWGDLTPNPTVYDYVAGVIT
jgi:hypothetical protein